MAHTVSELNAVLRRVKTKGTAEGKTPLQVLADLNTTSITLTDSDFRSLSSTSGAGKSIAWAVPSGMDRRGWLQLLEAITQHVERCATPTNPPTLREIRRMRVSYDQAAI